MYTYRCHVWGNVNDRHTYATYQSCPDHKPPDCGDSGRGFVTVCVHFISHSHATPRRDATLHCDG
ncbi:hypothetical protein J6590_092514 [Homalodisca vitripennis]|nr:hypothetical protein J6590_047260 [Homalodisca vitripennis]KAG8294895.1 hypothetical protein J6590_092514 [Homalodisca vitripennis]